MSIVEDLIKALQATLVPELTALKDKVDTNHREVLLRLDAMNQRFDDLLERLALARRIEALERERDERRAS